MEIERLYARLGNDVFTYFYPDVYLLNQEGDINQFNTFRKKGWKFYIDGGKVIKRTKDYCCQYSFDFKSKTKFKKELSFQSFSGLSGLNLLDFVNSVLNGNPEIFVKVENLITYDARKCLFEVINISINYSVIDEMFLQVLKRYFHKVERITFKNCIIKKECNLNSISADINLEHTIIENWRSLNDCTADISMIRSSISQMSPTTIKSKKLTISCLSPIHYVDLKMLFLKCNFPNLLSFETNPEIHYDTYSFEDAFIYLPDSAPNLEEIIIEGKVRNLDFLTKFKYLINCSVLSVYDDMDLRYANITDRKERKRIFEKNRYQYEIRKILFPSLEDKFIITELERERILRLCHFLSILSYTEEDKQILTEKDTIKALATKSVDTNVKYYYDCYYDTLHPKRQLLKKEMNLNYDGMYRFFGKYLCMYNPTKTLFQNNANQILQTKSFMFASNGLPIIFKGKKKPIRTIEDAKKKMSGVPNKEFNDYQLFIDFLKKYSKKIDEDILVTDFDFMIREEIDYHVSGSDFLAFGSAGKKISYAFDASKRAHKRTDDIRFKVDRYKKLLTNIIKDNYELFTVEEKAYMYYDKFDMMIGETTKTIETFKTLYETLVSDEEDTLENINLKTNGLYSKYRNYIRGFTKLESSLGNPYDSVYIKSEDIKQLILHL